MKNKSIRKKTDSSKCNFNSSKSRQNNGSVILNYSEATNKEEIKESNQLNNEVDELKQEVIRLSTENVNLKNKIDILCKSNTNLKRKINENIFSYEFLNNVEEFRYSYEN